MIPRTWLDNFDIKVVVSLNESASGKVLRLQNQQYILDCAKRSFKPRIMGHGEQQFAFFFFCDGHINTSESSLNEGRTGFQL